MASGRDAPLRIDPALVKSCVHCGFCLPACPTYALTGEEAESPRGRIVLMGALAAGTTPTRTIGAHLDHCLGCYACMTACPSGVRYDLLLEATRVELERAHTRTLAQRAERSAIFALFPHPGRIGKAARLIRLLDRAHLLGPLRWLSARLPLPGLARASLALAPSQRGEQPALPASSTPVRGSVGLLRGCVQDAFFGEINLAARRVLAAEGYTVVVPDDQGCCGALSEHAGRRDEARAMARGVIDAFGSADVEAVLVAAAGCGSAMKHYAQLLADDPAYAEAAAALAEKTLDVTEFLDRVEPRAPRHRLPLRVAYHDACHLAHGQGVRAEPRRLLAAIPGLEVLELGDGERCCGSAGVYNLLERANATALGDMKAAVVAKTGADVVVSGNPGCNLQLCASLARATDTTPVLHTLELLAASVAGWSPSDLGVPLRARS